MVYVESLILTTLDADAGAEQLFEAFLFGFQPCGVQRFPHLRGQRAAHGMGVLAGQAQAAMDGRKIVRIADHKFQDVFAIDRRIFLGERLFQAVQGDDRVPALVGRFLRLRDEGHLPGSSDRSDR